MIDLMEKDGIVGPPDGTRPREVLKGRDWMKEFEDSQGSALGEQGLVGGGALCAGVEGYQRSDISDQEAREEEEKLTTEVTEGPQRERRIGSETAAWEMEKIG